MPTSPDSPSSSIDTSALLSMTLEANRLHAEASVELATLIRALLDDFHGHVADETAREEVYRRLSVWLEGQEKAAQLAVAAAANPPPKPPEPPAWWERLLAKFEASSTLRFAALAVLIPLLNTLIARFGGTAQLPVPTSPDATPAVSIPADGGG